MLNVLEREIFPRVYKAYFECDGAFVNSQLFYHFNKLFRFFEVVKYVSLMLSEIGGILFFIVKELFIMIYAFYGIWKSCNIHFQREISVNLSLFDLSFCLFSFDQKDFEPIREIKIHSVFHNKAQRSITS